MTATKEELHRLVESLAEEELDEVRDFLEVRLREPEDLTEEGRHPPSATARARRRAARLATAVAMSPTWERPTSGHPGDGALLR